MKDEIMKLRYFSIKMFDMIPMTIEHLEMIKKEYDAYNKIQTKYDQYWIININNNNMKNNKQKFMHYAFLTVLYSFGTSVAGLIVYTMFLAITNIN